MSFNNYYIVFYVNFLSAIVGCYLSQFECQANSQVNSQEHFSLLEMQSSSSAEDNAMHLGDCYFPKPHELLTSNYPLLESTVLLQSVPQLDDSLKTNALKVQDLDTNQIQALTEEQIQGLTASQFSLFTASQVQSFLTSQVNFLLKNKYSVKIHNKLNEHQILNSDYNIRDQYNPNIASCCLVTQAGATYAGDRSVSIVRHSLDADPYQSGVGSVVYGKQIKDSLTRYINLVENRDYRYLLPTTLGKKNELRPMHFYIPSQGYNESEMYYLARRAEHAFDSSVSRFNFFNFFVPIGSGAVSTVFKVELADVFGLSPTVVKFRRLDVFGMTRSRTLLKKTLRRDLVMTHEITRLANLYTVNTQTSNGHEEWTHLIEVVPFQDFQQALHEGILVQPFVKGPSAKEIAKKVIAYQRMHLFDPSDRLPAGSNLRSWGFVSISEALQKLALLEQFYVLTHLDVIHFELDNHLTMMTNVVVGGQTPDFLVGIDYNHGENVIWSTDKQKWEIIDF